MKWFIKCLKNYANFRGRARRRELWYYVLIMYAAISLVSFVETLIFNNPPYDVVITPISWSLSLAAIVPTLAVLVRRLHDINLSGRWLLWYSLIAYGFLISLAYALVFFGVDELGNDHFVYIMLFFATLVLSIAVVKLRQKGMAGDNKYGSDPLAEDKK